MIIRLYTGDDGQAHFEDLRVPVGDTETIALKSGADMTFRSFPDGSFGDWHTAPRRQYVIVLSGQMEIGIGDGTLRMFGARRHIASGRPDRPGSHHPIGRRSSVRYCAAARLAI